MLFRWLALFMTAFQILFFLTGCEQIKTYRMKAYYEKAQNLYEAQDYRAALKELQYALVFNPDYDDAVILKAMCQYELKDYGAAASSFEYGALLRGLSGDLLMKAADARMQEGQFVLARDLSERILAKSPENAAALYINAKSRIRSRKIHLWRKALDFLEPLLAADDYKDEAFALLAELAIVNDNLAEAESILIEHAQPNDDWFFAMRVLAEKYESRGDYQSAARMYRKILELQPDSTADADLLLAVLRRANNIDEERQMLESLIAAAADDDQQIRYTLKLIDFYIYCGRLEEAERHIRVGLQRDEGFLEFSRYLIEVYEITNRNAEAIEVAKKVLSRVADASNLQVEFMNILARLYYMHDNPELAKFVIRWVFSIDRNSHAARFLHSRIALDEGRTLLAIAELRSLGSEDTDNPAYDYYLGLAHMERAEYNIAQQSFKEALQKQPSYKPALLKIAELYFDRGFFLDVERMVNEFLAVSPGDPDVLALQEKVAKRTVEEPGAE